MDSVFLVFLSVSWTQAARPLIAEEKCIDRNEFYRAGGVNPCGNLCKNMNIPCNNSRGKVIGGCDCIDGYARLKPGDKCVRIDDRRCQAAANRGCNSPCDQKNASASKKGCNCISGDTLDFTKNVLT